MQHEGDSVHVSGAMLRNGVSELVFQDGNFHVKQHSPHLETATNAIYHDNKAFARHSLVLYEFYTYHDTTMLPSAIRPQSGMGLLQNSK